MANTLVCLEAWVVKGNCGEEVWLVFWGRIVESLQCLAEETGAFLTEGPLQSVVLVCDGLAKSDSSSSNTEDRVIEGGELSGTDKRGDHDS